MKQKIVFATGNEGKMKEIRMILPEVEVLSLKEAGIFTEIEENGKTFEENALIKAVEIAKLTNDIVLADDSGLEIDYLNKEPGIYSARFLGEQTPYTEKNRIILERMVNAKREERSARFVCAIAAALPTGETLTTIETIEGHIASHPKGENGFGYDPIFFIPEFNLTAAQLSPEQKNKASHRGKALTKMKEILASKGIL